MYFVYVLVAFFTLNKEIYGSLIDFVFAGDSKLLHYISGSGAGMLKIVNLIII